MLIIISNAKFIVFQCYEFSTNIITSNNYITIGNALYIVITSMNKTGFAFEFLSVHQYM